MKNYTFAGIVAVLLMIIILQAREIYLLEALVRKHSTAAVSCSMNVERLNIRLAQLGDTVHRMRTGRGN